MITFFLVDIQEFYESILLDEQRDRLAKMDATNHLAEEWEKQPMLKRNIRVRDLFSSILFNRTSSLEWHTDNRISNNQSNGNQ